MSARTPWAQARSAYLMDNSRPGTSSRRRAEVLGRAARRSERAGAGVAAAAVQDELTPSLWRRLMGKEDRGWFAKVGLALVSALVAAISGPGIILGRYGIYAALVRWAAPRIGRLHWWPWAAAAGLLLGARWFVADWPLLGIGPANRYYPWEWVTLGGLDGWLQFQLVAALAMTAYSIRAWGWAGVGPDAVAPPAKKKDGSWNTAIDEDKARQIDPYAGEKPPPVQAAEPGRTEAVDTSQAEGADDLSDIDFTLPDRFPGEEDR